MTTKDIAAKDTATVPEGTLIEVNYFTDPDPDEVMMTLSIGDQEWMFPIEAGQRLADALQKQVNEARGFSRSLYGRSGQGD